MFFVGPQTGVTSNKHRVHFLSKFYELREPIGSDWRQLPDKVMPLWFLYKVQIDGTTESYKWRLKSYHVQSGT
jgi:hypothetical protein